MLSGGFIPGDKSLKPPFEKVISLHYTHKTFTEGRLHNTEMSYFSFLPIIINLNVLN